MALIVFSLIQPWWVLNASTNDGSADKNSEMFLIPQVMVEKVDYDGTTQLELATIPEIFTDFLGLLLLITSVGFVLLGISFLPNLIYKRRFYKILISMSILFLILVSVAYYYGMLQITEISLGKIQGKGVEDREISLIYIFILLYIVFLFIGTFVVAYTNQSYRMEDAFFEVSSAQGNAGITAGITQPSMHIGAKYMLIANMIVGRLEIIPILFSIGFLFNLRGKYKQR